MRPTSPDPFLFKGITLGSDFRWVLTGVEVWRGRTFLGVIAIEWFAQQLQHRLDDTALAVGLQRELGARADRQLGPAPDPALTARFPPAHMPSELKAQRRAARRSKHKRRASPAP